MIILPAGTQDTLVAAPHLPWPALCPSCAPLRPHVQAQTPPLSPSQAPTLSRLLSPSPVFWSVLGLEPTVLWGSSTGPSVGSAKLWGAGLWLTTPSLPQGSERSEARGCDQGLGWVGTGGGGGAGLGAPCPGCAGVRLCLWDRAERSPTWAVHGAASWPHQGASLGTGSGPGHPGGCWHFGGSRC